MKKILLIVTLFLLTGSVLRAQDDNDTNDKIRDKMTEFIQRRLNLSKNEAKNSARFFSVIFMTGDRR
jgi:hypothetical protein